MQLGAKSFIMHNDQKVLMYYKSFKVVYQQKGIKVQNSGLLCNMPNTNPILFSYYASSITIFNSGYYLV